MDNGLPQRVDGGGRLQPESVAAALAAWFILNQIFAFSGGVSGLLYYGVNGAIAAILLLYGGSYRINLRILAFVLAMLLSILLNDPDPVYQAPFRWLSCVIMLIAWGGLIDSEAFTGFRLRVFAWINLGMLLLVLSSLLALALGYVGRDSGGCFAGLSGHSMVLGSVSGFSFLNCYFYFSRKRSLKAAFRGAVLMAACLLSALLASSRIALGATAAGWLYLVWKRGRIRPPEILAAILLAALCLWSGPDDLLAGIMHKLEYAGEDLFSSRRQLWLDRWTEFLDSPVWGCGANTISSRLSRIVRVHGDGVIEPGSGWLFLLSSVGLVGTVLFLAVAAGPWLKAWRKAPLFSIDTLLGMQLSFYAVYMIAEAHITASGDYSFFYIWLCIGLINSGFLKTRIGTEPYNPFRPKAPPKHEEVP